MIAAAQNLGRLLAAEEGGSDCVRTCGPVAFFGVLLMFGLLCGGVWMLLQSSFGPLQAYLVAGAAFWGAWLVLAIIWFTGVPGIPIDKLPGINRGIPRSTPRYYGPTGEVPIWEPVPDIDANKLAARTNFWVSAEGAQRQSDLDQIKLAETEAGAIVAERYAEKLDVEVTDIGVPSVVVFTKKEFARSGGQVENVRFETGPAKPGDTATPEEKELIAKVQPETFVLKFNRGSVASPTRIALPLTFVLFLAHVLGLIWYERRFRSLPPAARERQREPEPASAR